MNGLVFTVVGVAPPTFRGVASRAAVSPNSWIPLSMSARLAHRAPKDWWLYLMGRLKPGSNVEEVRGRLDTAYRGVQEATNDSARTMSFEVRSGSRGISEGASDSLFAGLIIAAFVITVLLLIGCLNVANLLLARAAAREYEIEVRRAMGASRLRLIRQLLTESASLALMAGSIGTIFAYWGKTGFTSLPAFGDEFNLQINLPVLGLTAVVCLGASILFGLVPALQGTASRANLATGRNVRSFAGADSRTGRLLLVFQVAMSVVLLVGAIILVRMLGYWDAADAGFPQENLAVFEISPGTLGYNEERRRVIVDEVAGAVSAIPGVLSTSISDSFFGSGSARTNTRVFYGQANMFLEHNAGRRLIHVRSVSRDFFETMQVRS